eukprot:TRINITY_DN18757_c0_g1_i1.p1 TRINITY_DN18757_c0_g1~~TRINITY_DN18757_c0_g1_i1.p1  ORF type:complete len:440 (-),score=61.11 TRINITY_DN18757_c0_g1_i1:341-1660(-)
MAAQVIGNNRILCGGRFVSGPDVRSCAASTFMILLPSLLWHLEVGPYFADRVGILLQVVGLVAQVASVTLGLATAFSDPGIMPRQPSYSERYDLRTRSFRQKQPPRHYDLLLRGHPVKLKYCTTCNIYRPPRTTHCSVCDNCIERFDHHCPWIGNCVGQRNYWLFYSFVMVTGFLNLLVMTTSLSMVITLTQDASDRGNGLGSALVEAMGEAPMATAVTLYCASIVWFTVGLSMYHNYLICTSQTTYEQIKGAYTQGNNPFHRGILGNYREILCSRVRRRYFDASTMKQTWAGDSWSGTALIAEKEVDVFESIRSWDTIGRCKAGQRIKVAGPPVDVQGFAMVPIEPVGAVDISAFVLEGPGGVSAPSPAPIAAPAAGGLIAGVAAVSARQVQKKADAVELQDIQAPEPRKEANKRLESPVSAEFNDNDSVCANHGDNG